MASGRQRDQATTDTDEQGAARPRSTTRTASTSTPTRTARSSRPRADYDQFFKPDGTPKEFWANSEKKGDAGIMRQADQQVKAARGAPIEWRFKTPQAAEYYAQRFDREQ